MSEKLFDYTEIKDLLKNNNLFYVYVLYRPCGTPFYVGKGIKFRVFNHVKEARNTKALTHKLNVIRHIQQNGLQLLYRIVGFYENEGEAHQKEIELILQIGRHDLKCGPLTNQTDGGEGVSNPSLENLQQRRDSSLLRRQIEEMQIARKYFHMLTKSASIPIKPLKLFKDPQGLWKNREDINMTLRQAGSLVASALANRIFLKNEALIPRRFLIEKEIYIIENGAGRDLISSGMADLYDQTLGHEIFNLSESGLKYILSNFDNAFLIDSGLFLPTYEAV